MTFLNKRDFSIWAFLSCFHWHVQLNNSRFLCVMVCDTRTFQGHSSGCTWMSLPLINQWNPWILTSKLVTNHIFWPDFEHVCFTISLAAWYSHYANRDGNLPSTSSMPEFCAIGVPTISAVWSGEHKHRGRKKREDSRRYPCPNCPTMCSRSDTLQRHLKFGCYNEPRFKCAYCNYRTKWTTNMYKHVRCKHVGQPVQLIDIYETPI